VKALALSAPIVALGLMHVLYRLEVWALDGRGERVAGAAVRARATGGRQAPPQSALRRRAVPQRQSQAKASNHG
jgi:hypothetical protein